jgi:hypothetical protein
MTLLKKPMMAARSFPMANAKYPGGKQSVELYATDLNSPGHMTMACVAPTSAASLQSSIVVEADPPAYV